MPPLRLGRVARAPQPPGLPLGAEPTPWRLANCKFVRGINLKKEHMSINGNISTLLHFISTPFMPAPPEWYTTSDYGWQCFQYKIFLLYAKLKSTGESPPSRELAAKEQFFPSQSLQVKQMLKQRRTVQNGL